MKTIIELDEKDIQKIIADKFNCTDSEVTVYAKREYRGAGITEHEVFICSAKVTKNTRV